MKNICKFSSGFTLVELVIVIAVFGIMTSMAAPSFMNMMRDNRTITQTNELVGSLHLARSEAARRGVQVTIRSNSVTDNNWDQGWTVFTDWDGNGTFNDDDDALKCEPEEDCKLRIQAALPNNMTLRTANNYTTWLAYLPSGLPVSPGVGGGDTFRVCPSSADTARARSVVINITGRPNTQGETSSCP